MIVLLSYGFIGLVILLIAAAADCVLGAVEEVWGTDWWRGWRHHG
jgi:hypothetical protein